MSKTFSYGFTCPDINKNIENFQQSLSDHLDDMIRELCPLFVESSLEHLRNYRKGWEDVIYSSAEEYFENVRKINEEMRKEAEYQIENLIDEVEEHKKSSEYFERELDDAKDTIEDLKEQIEDLQSEMV